MKEIAFFGGLAVLLTSIMVNRHQNEKALALLTDEERGRFIGQFAKLRRVNLYALLAVFLLYVVFTYWVKSSVNSAIAYFGLLFVYISLTQYLAYKKTHEIQLPAAYMKLYMRIFWVRFAGLLVFFMSMLYYLYA